LSPGFCAVLQFGIPYLSFSLQLSLTTGLSAYLLASSEGWVTFCLPFRGSHIQTQASSCYQRRALDPTLRSHDTVDIGSISLVLFVFRVEVARRFCTALNRKAHQTFSGDPDVPYSGRLGSDVCFSPVYSTGYLIVVVTTTHQI